MPDATRGVGGALPTTCTRVRSAEVEKVRTVNTVRELTRHDIDEHPEVVCVEKSLASGLASKDVLQHSHERVPRLQGWRVSKGDGATRVMTAQQVMA